MSPAQTHPNTTTTVVPPPHPIPLPRHPIPTTQPTTTPLITPTGPFPRSGPAGHPNPTLPNQPTSPPTATPQPPRLDFPPPTANKTPYHQSVFPSAEHTHNRCRRLPWCPRYNTWGTRFRCPSAHTTPRTRWGGRDYGGWVCC